MNPMKEMSEEVCSYVHSFWEEMKRKSTINAARESYDESVRKARRLVDVNTIKHTHAREVGAENVCYRLSGSCILTSFFSGRDGVNARFNQRFHY